MRTGTAATLLNLQLLTANGNAVPGETGATLRAQRVGRSARRWAATLPSQLDGAELIRTFVRYRFGDASFAIRIRAEGSCAGERR